MPFDKISDALEAIALDGYPLRIVQRVPLITQPTSENFAYLSTKQAKLGHDLDVAQHGAPWPN